MAIPNYFEAAQLTPTTGNLEQAIGAGLSSASGLESIVQGRNQIQLQKGQLDLQKQQLAQVAAETQALPQQLQQEAQARQLNIQGQQANLANIPLQRQMMMHQLAAQNLSYAQSRDQYALNQFAQLGYLDATDRPKAYQQIRNELIGFGEDPKNLPPEYNQKVEDVAVSAMKQSPMAQQQLAFQQKVLLQQMSNNTQFKIAQLKNQGTNPRQKEYYIKAGDNDAAYQQDVNNQADAAYQIKFDAQSMLNTAGQIPKEFGWLSQGKVYFTAKGQELLNRQNDMIMAEFQQYKHIGRGSNVFLKYLSGSKPFVGQRYEAYINNTKMRLALANWGIERSNFANFLYHNGITDSTQIHSLWDQFTNTYDIIDDKGNPQPDNPSKWKQWLLQNPQILNNLQQGNNTYPPGFTVPGQNENTNVAQQNMGQEK